MTKQITVFFKIKYKSVCLMQKSYLLKMQKPQDKVLISSWVKLNFS